jgi:LPXTG-site transpeptidase (sortase) family protein
MNLTAEPQGFSIRGATILRGAYRIFFVIAALAISFVALTLLHARFYQEAALKTLGHQIAVETQQSMSRPGTVAKEGDVLGRIEIPRLGISVAILEGATSRTLLLGVGHIEGTALPGESGNSAIAGHRDTYFRSLRNIRPTDEIQIQTASGLSRYEVDSLQIVDPNNIGVLAPSAGTAITLVTCYPFRFIGAAPERFVVHAHKM